MIGWLRSLGRKRSPVDSAEAEKSVSWVLPFETDLHSHLIPGIDDGVRETAQSLEILRQMKEIGYRRMIMTPHVMQDSYRNSSETIRRGLDGLRRAATEAGLPIELHAAAEYYMDGELLARLERNDILSIDSFLLFETSYYSAPLNLDEMVYEMSARGYRPLMAHPERYRYVRDREAFYGRMKELGVYFQVNINSLGGYYGEDAKHKAFWLAERGWIDALGSDLHGQRQLEFLRTTLEKGILENVMKKNQIINDNLMKN